MATVLTNTGKNLITNLLAGVAQTAIQFVGWGTGTTAAAPTQTNLITPSAEARVSGTRSQITTTTTNDTYQVVATLASTSSQAITEAALFDAVTAGNMMIRGDFGALNLAASDSIQFTFRVQFT